MTESNMTRCRDLDDPQRCNYNIPGHGQCPMKAPEGAQNCQKHGGGSQLQAAARTELKAYQKVKWARTIKENGGDPAIKDLSMEVGILRMLATELLTRCKDGHDLLMYSGPISDMMTKIQKMVESLHKIDKEASGMLDQKALERFGMDLLDILIEEIDDANVIDRIGLKIGRAINKIQQPDEDI